MPVLPVSWNDEKEYSRIRKWCIDNKIGVEELHRRAVRAAIERGSDLVKEPKAKPEKV